MTVLKKYPFFLLLLCLLLAALPAVAADVPVAVISLVWGVVTVKHANEDYKPARWLEPIFVGDQVKTAGPGSKLLITFFNDNHQEVLASDSEASADIAGLSSLSGPAIRKDSARNPFGAGGVSSPFVYTHRLIKADFPETNLGMDGEKGILQARVRPVFPPSLFWQKLPEGTAYDLHVYDYTGTPMWNKTLKTHTYVLTQEQANMMPKGVTYTWEVKAGDQQVVARYPFNLLTLPQHKWAAEQRQIFEDKKASGKLERSDWTDFLLVCAQLNYVDEALDLLYKMADMDPQNPNVYRALTRVYLTKNCPAHAQDCHNKELQLGGLDPVYP
ncbi:hypothetical protein IV102_20895 [bacterium]|nr:hypothetical protein [bacterium]